MKGVREVVVEVRVEAEYLDLEWERFLRFFSIFLFFYGYTYRAMFVAKVPIRDIYRVGYALKEGESEICDDDARV